MTERVKMVDEINALYNEISRLQCLLDNALVEVSELRTACEDAISRKWVLNEIFTKVEDDESLTDEQRDSLSAAKYLIRHAPPVVPSAVPQQKRANKLSGTSEKQEEEAKP